MGRVLAEDSRSQSSACDRNLEDVDSGRWKRSAGALFVGRVKGEGWYGVPKGAPFQGQHGLESTRVNPQPGVASKAAHMRSTSRGMRRQECPHHNQSRSSAPANYSRANGQAPLGMKV